MPRVARRAGADGAVLIRFSDGVAVRTAARGGRRAFQRDEWVRRAPGIAGLIPLGEFHLFGLQSLLSVHGGPRDRCVAAAEKLLVDRRVTTAAIAGSQLRHDREPVVLDA